MVTFSGTNPELLLYDFNLLKNDTVKTMNCDFGSIPPCATSRFRVIDSIFYQAYNDGICRKTYKLKPYPNCANFTTFSYIIEGFGTEITLIDKITSTNNNFGGFGMGSMTNVSSSTLVINTTTLSTITNTCSQTVGVSENVLTNLKTYPNPANEKIMIENANNYPITSIELITVLGEKQNLQISHEGGKIIMNTSNLPDGIYFLHLRSNNSDIYKRIIKVQ